MGEGREERGNTDQLSGGLDAANPPLLALTRFVCPSIRFAEGM